VVHKVRFMHESCLFRKNKLVGALYYRANQFLHIRLGIKYRRWQVLLSVITDDMMHMLWQDSDGNHRVPNVNANSDGDFNFDLGNFENDWNSDNCLLAFCHSFVSPHHVWGVSFIIFRKYPFSNLQAFGLFLRIKG
jgi:hypothetical protein